MAKNNIRSFRFSDEVAAIIEKFKGDSLNDKFENLVLYCFWERKKIDDQLVQKRKEYDRLCKQVEEKRKQLYEYDSLVEEKQRLNKAITKIVIDVIDYKERLNKAMQEDVTQIDLAGDRSDPEKCVTKAG
ncbi:hypothetical protein [Marasmitruncus massiliensis]|uniref:hypothetical protein n=1 Tax=Marasmitruncus massiliensis TaxID=1944642 RepID=UPI000C7DA0AC|nr:hypothetical protein [Marasmitruncus massiliensis]